MASFHKNNMKILRLKNKVQMCRQCRMAPAEIGGLCPTCREYNGRLKRRELSRRGKFRGELPGMVQPWPGNLIEAILKNERRGF
ncbi:MAG: hypothetical protein K6U04_05585 [Armatimonadetes bacterium]|nr:hypothetical protein [Armatimonadota bacterium]